MSIQAPEFSKKIDPRLVESLSSESDGPNGNFRKLLEVEEVNEQPRKSLFALIEEEEEEEPTIITLPLSVSTPSTLTQTILEKSSAVQLPAQIEALFEKMASQMMIMDLGSETHTTLLLDQPQFERSSFFGTKIIIKEYTTAPKAFNIEIISNPQAINTIQNQQQNLLRVFAQGNFHFTIHRFDTQIEQDSNHSLLYRIEETDSDKQEQQEDEPS